MALDALTHAIVHAGLRTLLDSLPSDTPLLLEAQSYLLASHVEDKSQATINTYAYLLRDFLKFNKAAVPTASDFRLFLYSVKQHEVRGHKNRPATIHAYYRCLKSWCNWLVAEEETDVELELPPPWEGTVRNLRTELEAIKELEVRQWLQMYH